MKILSIDTACKTAMAALSEGDKVISAIQLHDSKTHSVKMLPAVEYILKAADVAPSELGAVAVTNGPGSYTGLRIGVTTAKTLSYALNIPVLGINTLDAIAATCNFTDNKSEIIICPMIDARNERVYSAAYKAGEIIAETVASECAQVCSDLLKLIQGTSQRILFTGDGSVVNKKIIEDALGEKCLFAPTEFSFGSPQGLARVACKKYSEAVACDRLSDFTAEGLKVNYYKNYTDSI